MTNSELRDALVELGLSRSAFAKLMGTHRVTISRWCSNPENECALAVPLYVDSFILLALSMSRRRLRLALNPKR
jgi:hypothetical protein